MRTRILPDTALDSETLWRLHWERLTPEERAELVEIGERVVDSLLAEANETLGGEHEEEVER